MPKVSIIIPVYEVDQYIERCARSLFEQTLDDMEFIFVNDCTTDKSIEILRQVIADYPTRQSQIKIVTHETNRGLPQARMTGFTYATGDYIAHCDSDDWVDVTMYGKMYKEGIIKDADLVVCDFHTIKEERIIYSHGCYTTNKKQFLSDLLFTKISWAVWNKMIKRSILEYNKVLCPLGNIGEDMVFTIQFAQLSSKIGHIKEGLYNYRVNNTSMTNQMKEKLIIQKFTDICKNIQIIEPFIESNIRENFTHAGIVHIIVSSSTLLVPILKQKKYYLLWMEMMKKKKTFILLSPKVPIKDKIEFCLIYSKIVPNLIKSFKRTCALK